MPEARWLTDDEQVTWLSYLLATRRLWAVLERDLQRDTGLPLTYYEILSVLSEVPNNAARMTDLASMLQLSPSRLSHAMTRLEGAGWVQRELHPTDRRGWIAVLTGEGRRRLESAAPVHVDSVRKHLFDQLSSEQVDQLGEMSRDLLKHLAPGLDIETVMRTRSVDGCEPACK